MSNLDDVIRRIGKMLAMAEDGRGDANEAAVAASMAQKLMEKYQLTRADVIRKAAADGVGVGCEVVFCTRQDGRPARRVPDWVQWYAVQVARLNSCEIRIGRSRLSGTHVQEAIRVYGFDGDREVAAQTIKTIFAMARRCAIDWGTGECASVSMVNSYLKGFSLAVSNRVIQMAEKRAQEARGDSRALMFVKHDALVKKFGKTEYERNVSFEADEQSFVVGFKAGRAVNLETAPC